MTDRKPQDQDKFIIRMPEGLRERIKHASDMNNRSMNAEIVATLEERYPPAATRLLWEMVQMAVAYVSANHVQDGPVAYWSLSEETIRQLERAGLKIDDNVRNMAALAAMEKVKGQVVPD